MSNPVRCYPIITQKKCKNESLVPICLAVLSVSSVVFVYILAVRNHDVMSPTVGWPLISESGDKPPESFFFTLSANWCAFFYLVTAYIYYKYVEVALSDISLANILALFLAIVFNFGITLVASYKRDYSIISSHIHMFGAVLGLVGSNIYVWLIIYTNHLIAEFSKCLIVFRYFIALLQSSALVTLLICYINYEEIGHVHTISGVAEWAAVLLSALFFGTLAYEFCSITSVDVKVEVERRPLHEELLPLFRKK